MTARLARLVQLAALRRDLALAEVAVLRARQDRILAQIDGLNVLDDADAQLPELARRQLSLKYEGWADGRRRVLNQDLARLLVDLEQAQSRARPAQARATVLERLSQSKPGKITRQSG